jgi:hypothetical protein
MTDIVYILGDGAAAVDDRPLRWSLRSLAKHAENVGRVIICGRIPEWLSDEVVKIPTDETTMAGRGKAWNILYAYRAAIEGAGLDRPFLYSSDDHYLLPAYTVEGEGEKAVYTPVRHDMDAWPRFIHGDLPVMTEFVKKNKIPGWYNLCLMKTRSVLARESLSTRQACLHLNTWADPQDVAPAIVLAEKYAGLTRQGFEATCLINAYFEKRMKDAGITPVFTKYKQDWKVNTAKDIEKKIKMRLPGFTTSPKAELRDDIVMFMENYYSEPSKWEKSL